MGLTSGESFSLVRDTAPGDPDQPLSREELEAKLRRAAPDRADDLLAALNDDNPAVLLELWA